MNFVLIGLLWLFVAVLAIYFINMSKKKSSSMIRAGMAMIILSFLVGIFILFAAAIL